MKLYPTTPDKLVGWLSLAHGDHLHTLSAVKVDDADMTVPQFKEWLKTTAFQVPGKVCYHGYIRAIPVTHCRDMSVGKRVRSIPAGTCIDGTLTISSMSLTAPLEDVDIGRRYSRGNIPRNGFLSAEGMPMLAASTVLAGRTLAGWKDVLTVDSFYQMCTGKTPAQKDAEKFARNLSNLGFSPSSWTGTLKHGEYFRALQAKPTINPTEVTEPMSLGVDLV